MRLALALAVASTCWPPAGSPGWCASRGLGSFISVTGAGRPTWSWSPDANPFLLREGGELPLRLVYRDQPLEGALVVALGAREPDRRVAARTDAVGRAVLKPLRPGAWLVKSVHMIEATDGGADWDPGGEPVASP